MKKMTFIAAMVLCTAPLQALETLQWQINAAPSVSDTLDCMEEGGFTLISAHRGGPTPGLPENSIPAMDAMLYAAPAIMEVDVAQSPDGVHYLMHDRSLDRTTNGEGDVATTPWEVVEQLYLVDEAGWRTPYRVPTFEETLEWAKGHTILQIDFKRTSDFAEVIALVRAAEMADSVILIAYTVEAAKRLHTLAPEMLISAGVDDAGDVELLQSAGIPADRIVAFTGTRTLRPDLYAQLDEGDVEVIFGTLGRSPRSLDNLFAQHGTDERYAELGQSGVDIIATDRPRAAARALKAAERLPQEGQCGVSRD